MARRVSAADFDVERGSAKDAKTLRRFLAQEGFAGRAVIEDVLARGGPKLLEVAWLALADLDEAGAQARALAAAEGAEALKNKKAKRVAVRPLQFVATGACLDRLEALGIEVDPYSLPPEAIGRAQRWGLEKVLSLSEGARQVEVLSAWFKEGTTLDALRGALGQPSLTAEGRRAAFARLIGAGDLETCRREDLPAEFAIAARLALPPAEAFDRLLALFQSAPSLRPELIRALARRQGCDPRWVEWFSSLDDRALRLSGLLATRRVEALPLLASLIGDLKPGPVLLEALADLRGFDSPEAAELIVPWLGRSELDGNAALLATSLRSCGAPAHLPALEAAARRNPDGAMFYAEAIAHIRARHAT